MKQSLRDADRTGPPGPQELDVDRIGSILALGGVPRQDLEDALQLRLKLVEQRVEGGEPLRDVAAWGAVVASRVAVDWHRSRRRQQRLADRLLAVRAQPARDASCGEDQQLLAMTVAEQLDLLTAVQRQVIVLRFYADLSVPQIAEALEIPEGTGKSRLNFAFQRMRSRLGKNEVR